MTGDQGTLKLRQHGVGEAEDAGPYLVALGKRDQQVVPNLLFDAAFAVPGGTQLAEGAGQAGRTAVVRGNSHVLHATTAVARPPTPALLAAAF
jgi:hypothetical protein